jgi:hypothetical protein
LIVTIATALDPDDLTLAEGQVVSCTFVPAEDGEYMLRPVRGGPESPHRAVYFAAPDGASDVEMAALAFEVREGRPMEQYQLWCIEEAKQSA